MTNGPQDPASPGPDQREPAPTEAEEALRRRAEARADSGADSAAVSEGTPLSVEEAREVLHNLRVHKIELELQNEELRRMQGELEASRARYFELYDRAPVAYLTLSEGGVILEANRTSVPLLGADRTALKGQPFTHFVGAASQDEYYHHRRGVCESGETGEPGEAGEARSCEIAMQRADGSAFLGRVVSTPATGPGGERVSRVVVTDVTERQEAEDRRLKLEQRIQQAEKAESLGRMAGSISHHFNNLLGVVIGNLELLKSEGPAAPYPQGAPEGNPQDDPQDGPLDDALTAARSAAEVSTTLLGYLGQSREEQGPQRLSEIVRQSLPMLRAAMPLGTELESDLPLPGPMVKANVDQIRQVLQNLVTNAWEASLPDRGTIFIALREIHRDEIPTTDCFPRGWNPRGDRYAALSVTDRGPGIAQGRVEQIFDPFFSGKEYGRGLGLSVALGSVRAHDGAIAVLHPPEGGTTMDVYLPVSDPAVPVAVVRPAPPVPSPGTGVILLVDDEPMLRSVGSRMIKRLGYEVVTAGDGIEALQVFDEHAHRITCVICDLTMPRMNGWDTLAALRKRRPGLPVVLTSGFDESQAMAGDRAEQPQVFMGKPWSQAEIKASIQRAMG